MFLSAMFVVSRILIDGVIWSLVELQQRIIDEWDDDRVLCGCCNLQYSKSCDQVEWSDHWISRLSSILDSFGIFFDLPSVGHWNDRSTVGNHRFLLRVVFYVHFWCSLCRLSECSIHEWSTSTGCGRVRYISLANAYITPIHSKNLLRFSSDIYYSSWLSLFFLRFSVSVFSGRLTWRERSSILLSSAFVDQHCLLVFTHSTCSPIHIRMN